MTAASTKEAPSTYDAWDKAEPGEPIFMLIGRDPDAPAVITYWAHLTRNRALRLYGGSDSASDKELLAAVLRKCANAEEAALEFGEWRTGHVDQPGERVGYQQVIRSVEEQAAAARALARDGAVRNLREAAYHLCEAKDALVQLELIGEPTQHDLDMALARINGLADEHTPKRAGFEAEPALPLDGQVAHG